MMLILLGIGVFGCLGLSALCPLLAFPGYYLQCKIRKHKSLAANNALSDLSRIDIIIPAHNEAEQIGGTLGRIQRAVQHIQKSQSPYNRPAISVQVGADGCEDETVRIAKQFPRVSVREFPENRSKWTTIKTLLAESTADWVILVDAGTLWPETLLTDVVKRIQSEPHAMAIAPSYRPLRAGWLHGVIWRMETYLKSLESYCGGPISLHGATVGYKTNHLKNVLAYLGTRHWLNDDVVIPLILRGLYPEGVILYPVGHVQDAGARNDQLDLSRRNRILLGNLDWAKALLFDCFRMNSVAGIVALRRLFRVFWAYWLACIALGTALAFHVSIWPMMVIGMLLAALSGSFRQLTGAALISPLAPFRMVFPNWQMESTWK